MLSELKMRAINQIPLFGYVPIPSGSGLHVGHPEGYTATDIISRYKRLTGHNVLHPIGGMACGLPAEQHAVKTGTHPRVTTKMLIILDVKSSQ